MIKALTIFLKSRRGVNFAETSLGQYRARLQQTKLEITSKDKGEAVTSAARGEQLISERSCTAWSMISVLRSSCASRPRAAESRHGGPAPARKVDLDTERMSQPRSPRIARPAGTR